MLGWLEGGWAGGFGLGVRPLDGFATPDHDAIEHDCSLRGIHGKGEDVGACDAQPGKRHYFE